MVITRKLREWYPGAAYHLMERGVRRQPIFQDESDYQVFKAILQTGLHNNECSLQAYCLMTNHFHLLLKTQNIEVSRFMKFLANSYANYFNRKHGYCGHLFEGRYRGIMVTEDAYFLQTGRYIHLNPVKAGIVEHPEDYKWSSYQTIIGITDDKMTAAEDTLCYFGKNRILEYRNFVEDSDKKFMAHENQIRRSMGEDELWLPW